MPPIMTERDPCLSPLTRQDVGISVLLAVGALALYVRTLAPTLLLGDSAEFQTLAATLGLAHPTGYPLYLLVGKLFTWLPIGSIAYRVNLLSACAAALVIGLLYLLGRRLGSRPSAALAGPLALAVCDLFWWHAVIAEVYTLGAAVVAGVLLLLMNWRHTGDWRFLFAAGLLGGLSLGVHSTVALAAPAALIYLMLTARRWASWTSAIVGTAAGVALALVAFLILDARDAPASFYNSTVRPWLSRWDFYSSGFATPVQRIAFLMSARQFQSVMGGVSPNDLEVHLSQYWDFLRRGWSLPAIGLMIVGLATTVLWRPNRMRAGWHEALMLLLVWLCMLVFVLNYTVRDIYVFYIPTYVPLTVLASLGASALLDAAAALLQRFSQRLSQYQTPSRSGFNSVAGSTYLGFAAGRVAAWPRAARGTQLIGAILLLAVLWPALAVVRDSVLTGRITFLDRTEFAAYPYPVRTSEIPHRRAVEVVAQLEDNAIVFTDWGTVFTIYYVAHVEQGRTGIAAHEWFAHNDNPSSDSSVIRYIDANLIRRPIYFTFIPERLRPLYTFAPVGEQIGLFRLTDHHNTPSNSSG
jgi:hypothetical protein